MNMLVATMNNFRAINRLPRVIGFIFLCFKALPVVISASDGGFIQDLLFAYNTFERPKEPIQINGEEKNVTTLTCLMQLIWLFDVDATRNEYGSLANMHCEWFDRRVSWELSEFDEESVQIPINKIWFPSFAFTGNQTPEPVKPDIVTIFNNGRVIFNYMVKETWETI